MTPDMGIDPLGRDASGVDVPGAPAIPGLRFRHYAGPADHREMDRVCNLARRADGDPEVSTVEALDVDYAHLINCDPARDVLLAEVDGMLVAYGRALWEDMNDSIRGYQSFGFVDPAWRRQGIGWAMHRWFEARNVAIAADHDVDRPRALISWGYDENAGNVALLQRSGYAVDRRFLQMVRPTLEAIDVAPLPDGLEVRPGSMDHGRVVFEADAEAFRDHWGAVHTSDDAFETWRDQPATDPSLWVIAWDGDQVAGGVLGLISAEENEAYGYRRGWLDSVFVRRPWRQRGLAKALIGRTLERLRDRGMTSAQLGVDVDNVNRALDLYTGTGFAVVRTESAWRKPWPGPVAVPDGESALTDRRLR